MRIGIIGYDNCFMSTVTGLYEFFQLANSLQESGEEIIPTLVTVSDNACSFSGFQLKSDCSIESDTDFDWIVLPAQAGADNEMSHELVSFLKEQNKKGVKIGTVCAGVRWLAETGLLNGRTATSHWNIADSLREQFPLVNWQTQKMLVHEGDFVTAGGVMAWQELALFIIGKEVSMELASLVSKVMLIDSHRVTQSPYEFIEFPISKSDVVIADSQRWMHENYGGPVTIDLLADLVFLSKRTYARRFKKATNYTPITYLQELRIQECKHLLESCSLSFEEITGVVGYQDVNTFRSLFIKRTGISPKQYRIKFSLLL